MNCNSEIQETLKKQRNDFFKKFDEQKQIEQEASTASGWKKVKRLLKDIRNDIRNINFKKIFDLGEIFTINYYGKRVNIFEIIANEQKKAAALALITNPIVIKKEEPNFSDWKTYLTLPKKQKRKKFKKFAQLRKTKERA